MLRPQAEQLADEIRRNWGGRLYNWEVLPGMGLQRDGWVVRAWDAEGQTWTAWDTVHDRVGWKMEQRRRGP